MSTPFYVSPEQLLQDRSDFARKGIGRGRSVVVVGYGDGIALVAENTSELMHKVSEIYDRIGFAAVGKFIEFENLRVAGVRYADLRGYNYDRSDVTARGLCNAYAQTLGMVFTTENKPLEVEIAVAEVGRTQEADQLYRLTFDGSVYDEPGYVAMGGSAEAIRAHLAEHWRTGLTLAGALQLGVDALGQSRDKNEDALDSSRLEIAVLRREHHRRAFLRLRPDLITRLLAKDDPTTGLTEDS